MSGFSTAKVREVMRQANLPDTRDGYRDACSILGRRAAAAKRSRKLRAANGGRLRADVEAARVKDDFARRGPYWWETD